MQKPILFLTVGLPGSGKTTKAKELESKFDALRLTKDEWVTLLLGVDSDRARADVLSPLVEDALWKLALRALDLGNNVIIDFGLCVIEERKQFREEAQSHGAQVYFIPCEAPLETLWERVSSREESQSGTLHITYEEMRQWEQLFQPLTEDESQYIYKE